MIFVIIIAFLTGFLAAAAAHHLAHKDEIRTIKEDAKKALQAQAIESFAMGWMRCYKDEVTRKFRKIDLDVKAPALLK